MSEDFPALISVGAAQRHMGLTEKQLYSIYHHLHILQLPQHSRRISATYLEHFMNFLRTSTRKRRADAARDFASESIAYIAITSTEVLLARALARKFEKVGDIYAISAVDLAQATSVHRTTITDWDRANELATFHRGKTLYVGELAVAGAFRWQRPLAYPGSDSVNREHYAPVQFQQFNRSSLDAE